MASSTRESKDSAAECTGMAPPIAMPGRHGVMSQNWASHSKCEGSCHLSQLAGPQADCRS
eukprot:1482725-Rhodomonas_salina.2